MRWVLSVAILVGVGLASVMSYGRTSAVAPSRCGPPTGSANPLRILVLGDSIAAGSPLSAPDRWSDRMEATLQVANPGRCVEARNVAVGGTMVDFLEASVAQPDLDTFDIAIVFEGVNDLGYVPFDEWRTRYEAAVGRLEAHGLKVIVGTPPPTIVDGLFEHKLDVLAAAERSIACDHGRPLLDIERRWRGIGAKAAAPYYVDAIHQGGLGQVVMADLAARLIEHPPVGCQS
jgi:lysophospholipase L1-like esterase